jgi:hypothetical protein
VGSFDKTNQVLCVAASGLLKSKPPTAIHVLTSRSLDRSVNSFIMATSSGCAGTTLNVLGSMKPKAKNSIIHTALTTFQDHQTYVHTQSLLTIRSTAILAVLSLAIGSHAWAQAETENGLRTTITTTLRTRHSLVSSAIVWESKTIEANTSCRTYTGSMHLHEHKHPCPTWPGL